MVLYTPVPLEDVLAEKEEQSGNSLSVPYHGGIIEVEMTSAVTAKIIRLHSHTVNDYLQPHLQPGAEIKLNWGLNTKTAQE